MKNLFRSGFIVMAIAILISSCSPTAPKSGDKEITTFSIVSPPAGGIIDTSAKTITVLVPRGTDLSALVATFTTTGAKVSVGSAEQVSGVTANNFAAPVGYTVTAEDNSTVNYTITVTFQKYCLFVSTLSDTGDARDVPVINKLRSWGYEVNVVASSTTLTWTVADSFSQYDFAFLSESPNSSDYAPFRGHPLPMIILEAWACAKVNVLNWSKYPAAVSNYDSLPLIIAAGASAQLTGGLASGLELKFTNGCDSTAEGAEIGFIPTISNIPMAMFKCDTLIGTMVATIGVDSSALAFTGGLLTAACAVETGTLLADSVTATLNRAVAIGIHADSYQYITEEAYAMILAGIQWVLKE
jgi:hypothetical protein